jgi:tetratricopeptide (TPR) repeat protein
MLRLSKHFPETASSRSRLGSITLLPGRDREGAVPAQALSVRLLLIFALALPVAAQTDATNLYSSGRFDEAATEYRNAIAANPTAIAAKAGLVRTLLKQDKAGEAEAAVKQFTIAHPTEPTLLTLAGDIQFRQGFFDDARMSYLRSFKFDKQSARTLLGLGRLQASEKRQRIAAGFFRRAYALDANDPDVIEEWADTLENPEEEIAALEKYLLKATNEAPEKLLDVRNHIGYLAAMGSRRTATLLDPPETANVRLTLIEGGPRNAPRGFGIAIAINGGKPATLLFDTGAGGITIHRKLADKLGVKPLASSRLRGVGDGGSPTASIGIADEVRIGDLIFKDIPVTISDQKAGNADAGLIGSNIFHPFLVTIDGPRRMLRLHLRRETAEKEAAAYDAITPPGEEDFTRVRCFNHLMLVDTLAGGKKRGWFLIDSGASGNMISLALARAVPAFVAPGAIQLTGVSGRVDRSFTVRGVDLLFAGFRNPNPEMHSFDFQKLNKSVRTEISGLLGFPTLEILVTTIDYRNGLVKFQKGK